MIFIVNFAANLIFIMKIAKKILEKITTPRTFLDVSEISAEEKKKMMSFFAEKGITTTTFYLRFFQKGFFSWEILGVTECKKLFLELPEVAKALLEHIPDDPKSLEGDKGYLYTLAQSDEPGRFYQCLKQVRGLCSLFTDFMEQKGMSPATTIKRFTSDDDWKPWEVEGVRALLQQYMEKGNA